MAEYNFIKKGISRHDRKKKAIPSDYFLVEERSFFDLVSLCGDYAGLLKFYEAGNLEIIQDKNWSKFFLSNEIYIFSYIFNYNIEKFEFDFQTTLLNEHPDLSILKAFNLKALLLVDEWLALLSGCGSDICLELADFIYSAIEKNLKIELKILEKIEFFISGRVSKKDLSRFWTNSSIDSYDLSVIEKMKIKKSELKDILSSNFFSFSNILKDIKEKSLFYKKDILYSKNNSPELGLLFSFLKISEKAKDSLNEFIKKHQKFYYDEVLKIREKGPEPDCVYLTFKADNIKKYVHIPEKTRFLGKDSNTNEEVCFESLFECFANNGEIKRLYTLFLDFDENIIPEYNLGFYSGMRLNSILTAQENKLLEYWPVLGCNPLRSRNIASTESVLGFALSSDALFLREGARTIKLKLNLNDNSWKFIELKLQESLDYINKSNLKDLFYKFFAEIFKIEISCENGWFKIDEYSVSSNFSNAKIDPGIISLEFNLAPDAPAVIGFNKDIHGIPEYNNQPVLKFYINYNNYIFPYSLLKEIQLKSIDLLVSVKGLKKLVLQNKEGRLDPNTPFAPFGSIPGYGSYFLIGAYELLHKNLSTCSFNIIWDNLPQCTNGFSEYYKAYSKPFDNDIFKASIKGLHSGEWQPKEENKVEIVNLFSNLIEKQAGIEAKTDKISNIQKINNIAVPTVKSDNKNILEQDFEYSINSRNGFFQFSLCSPEYAFGHGDYQHEISSILMKNAKLKKLIDIPNIPYTPIIKELTLDYTSGDTCFFSQESLNSHSFKPCFFHISPFGSYGVSSEDIKGHMPLIPEVEHRGNLVIGIEPQDIFGEISFYFDLKNNASYSLFDPKECDLNWSYLDGDKWIKLREDEVVYDSTFAFLKEGVVRLIIPERRIKDNLKMEKGFLWIKASGDVHPEKRCSFKSIEMNAVEALRVMPKDYMPVKPPFIEAQTIDKFKYEIKGMASINQPNNSFGGKPAEKDFERELRIKERLIHKNRIVSPKDYELMILENFPGIYKVKCFSNLSIHEFNKNNSLEHPGNVLLVVIPDIGTDKKYNEKIYVNSIELLKIKEFIEKRCSPFINIEVANPFYERIQTRCAVRFCDNQNKGAYIKELSKDISKYLSPWYLDGYSIDFGWKIETRSLREYIKNLSYVDFITDFSMIQIADISYNEHSFFDTMSDSLEKIQEHVVPNFPWSLPIPMEKHFINVIDFEKVIKPQPVGIDEIETGRTFIIQRNSDNGKKEQEDS